uniref:Trans-2,3-enoyl-CoA reductase-like 2b n=1 Tax=Astyanax mexicanus TaxID=7994 RepID=A0A8B9JDD4_ASTMX
LKHEPKNVKNYVFFEVEVLDPDSRTQLCYLDKVRPNATTLLARNSYHSNTIATTRTQTSQHLFSVGTVFLAESVGPLFVYLLFYYRLPFIYGPAHSYSRSPHAVVRLACICHTLHYIKRLVETIFVHRFSQGTLPVQTIMLNCVYYWGFAAWLAYYINHPLYTTPSEYRPSHTEFCIKNCIKNVGLHHIFLGGLGSKPTQIPNPTNNPFTWLFFFVSCPNYTYEVCAWLSFTVMTQCVPVGVFTFIGFVQMTIWAREKHRTYVKECKDYPELRSAIIPLFL